MSDPKLLSLTADIVTSYVQQNNLPAPEVSSLIRTVHAALSTAGQEQAAPEVTTKATPAQIRKSITPDALISFEDGKPYKTLRRHLAIRDLTPADYRTKWGLPDDYPMTAPSYSAQRSEMAKAIGLGAKGAGAASAKAAKPASKGEKAKSGKARSGQGS